LPKPQRFPWRFFSYIGFLDDLDYVYRKSMAGNSRIKIVKKGLIGDGVLSPHPIGLGSTIQLQKHLSILRAKSNDN